MDDRTHSLNHRLWSVALEDVAAHVDPRRSFVHRLPGHLQGFELWQLLSPRDYQWNRTACGDPGKAFLTKVGLHKVRSHFGAYAGGEPKVLGIPYQVFAHTSDGHRGHAITIAGVDHFDQVANRLMFVHAADVDLNRQGGGIEANGIVDVDRDQLVR